VIGPSLPKDTRAAEKCLGCVLDRRCKNQTAARICSSQSDLIHMNRFIRGSMTAAYTLDITARDFQAIQEAAASRVKRDGQPGTVAAKFEVVKVSECRELASVRAKKEEEKAKRAEKRKEKAELKKRPSGVTTAEFLLS